MFDDLTADVAGTKVYLIGEVPGTMGAVADWLRLYRVEVEVFLEAQLALKAGRPHVVAYVKSDGRKELDLIRTHFHTARLLVIAPVLNEHELVAFFEMGIQGWVTEWEPVDLIASAILLLCRGGAGMSLSVLEVLQRRAGQRELSAFSSEDYSLTSRQLEIVRLLSRGHSDKEIAVLLTLSVRTVQRHVQDVLQRLGVHSREAAIGVMHGETPP